MHYTHTHTHTHADADARVHTYTHMRAHTHTHTHTSHTHLELNDCPNPTKLWQHVIIKGLESFIQLSFLKLDRGREGPAPLSRHTSGGSVQN